MNTRSVYFFLFVGFAVLYLMNRNEVVSVAQAENVKLFTNSARARAEARSTSRIVRGRGRGSRARSRAKTRHADSNTTAEDLQVDSVDDIIETSEARYRLVSEYRGIEYLGSLTGNSDLQLDEVENRAVAEKLFFLETADSFSSYLLKSPLAEFFKEAVRGVRTLHDYTTVNVSRSGENPVRLGQSSKGIDESNQLFRFKVHASARRGIEPRIEFNKNLRLKYDAIHKDSLLECEFDF